ncbi:MAG: CHAD domain-containing protein [Micropruina sp.]|nr:CHAD domain-containing protein [Micropruina sp.]
MSRATASVESYLSTQAEVIANRADDVLVDAPDAVHRSRVATRRARSALRTFGPLFKNRRTRALRDELAWHADRLGAPRDAEVLKQRLLATLDVLSPDQVVGPVRQRLADELDLAHAAAHAQLVVSMQTTRYQDLRATLHDFVADPPLSKAGGSERKRQLADLLTHAIDRARRLYVRAEEVPDDLHMWHEVRKAAKAARYCSEALVDAFGEAAELRAEAWEQVTEALGEVQDTVVAEQTLIRHAATALGADEPVETYLALEGVELRQREQSLATGRRVLAEALLLPPLR